MITFPSVSPLLQELDRKGAAEFGTEWDDKVRQAICDLRNKYTQLRHIDRKLIDYSSLPVHMAYCFVYAGANANCLFQVLNSAKTALGNLMIGKSEMNVTSWGGGLGSDLLALVAMLRNTPPDNRPKKINYRVLDKQPNWHEILQSVALLQKGTVAIDISFEAVDVTIPDLWSAITNENDDILIMNYFVSEVCVLKLGKSVRECLKNSLSSLKTDCILIYNDSNFFTVLNYFDQLYKSVGNFQTCVLENSQLNVEPDFDDFFRNYMARFDGTSPKLASNAAYRVLRKK
jgi:hypothetical protein